MDIIRKTLDAQTYIYVEKECPYGPDIGPTMGAAFGEVFGLLERAGVQPRSMPMSVYMEMDPEILRFRGGVIVSSGDAAKLADHLKSDVLPAGDAMFALHFGPYDRLSETHQAMWAHMAREGIDGTMPVWEIYIDDPEMVAPDATRTEIYCAIA